MRTGSVPLSRRRTFVSDESLYAAPTEMDEVLVVEKPVAGKVAWRAKSAAAGVGCVSSVDGNESSGGAEVDAILSTSVTIVGKVDA